MLYTLSKTDNKFNPIATIYPDRNTYGFTPFGEYLKDRVTLTSFREKQTEVILSFDEIRYDDETDYRWEVVYAKNNVVQPPIKADIFKIIIKSKFYIYMVFFMFRVLFCESS